MKKHVAECSLVQLPAWLCWSSGLMSFHTSTDANRESILTSCAAVWDGNGSGWDQKGLQKVVKTAEGIAGASLPTISDIYRKHKDSSHPVNDPPPPPPHLPEGATGASRKRKKNTKSRNSLFPTDVSLLDSPPLQHHHHHHLPLSITSLPYAPLIPLDWVLIVFIARLHHFFCTTRPSILFHILYKYIYYCISGMYTAHVII